MPSRHFVEMTDDAVDDFGVGENRDDLHFRTTFEGMERALTSFKPADGQVQALAIKSLGLKIGKRFRIGGDRELEVAANVFNLFNWGDHHQYSYGSANAVYSPNFLQLRNLQTALALQLTAIFRY